MSDRILVFESGVASGICAGLRDPLIPSCRRNRPSSVNPIAIARLLVCREGDDGLFRLSWSARSCPERVILPSTVRYAAARGRERVDLRRADGQAGKRAPVILNETNPA